MQACESSVTATGRAGPEPPWPQAAPPRSRERQFRKRLAPVHAQDASDLHARRVAFTGADRERRGMIERAAGGTLLLDEIGDLSLASQVKLLRLLQEREYYPIGSDVPHRADARVVAATNGRELRSLIFDAVYRMRGSLLTAGDLQSLPGAARAARKVSHLPVGN